MGSIGSQGFMEPDPKPQATPGDWATQSRDFYPWFAPRHIHELMVVPLAYQGQNLGYLSLFRQTKPMEIPWAGQTSPDPRHYRPRQSFDLWRENRQISQPWQPWEIQWVQGLGLHLYLSLVQRWLQTLHRHHTTHDPLTHLPNPTLLSHSLSVALLRNQQQGEVVAVAIVNLDRFRAINESFGHTVGNELLREAAYRLQCHLLDPSPDPSQGVPLWIHKPLLGRWHGDSFVVVWQAIQGQEEAIHRGQEVLQQFLQPFQVHGEPVYLTASLGIALAPYHGHSVEILLKHGEAALSQAKRRGKNTCEIYSSISQIDHGSRIALEADLRRALDREEFILNYQPQVELATGQVVGVEALVRWQHPRLGLVAPSRFIPLAEEIGLLQTLSRWILETACRQHWEWQQRGLPPLRMAVNVSPLHFESKHFVGEIQHILKKTGINPQYLEVEITEESTAKDLHQTVERLQQLYRQGIRITLDDFGQGYSCLSALKHFPIHMLKIDRSFIQDVAHDPSDAAIARSIMALGEGLHLEVLAEGVETLDQLQFLQGIGCHFIQGYLFSRPLSAEGLEQWFHNRRVKIPGDGGLVAGLAGGLAGELAGGLTGGLVGGLAGEGTEEPETLELSLTLGGSAVMGNPIAKGEQPSQNSPAPEETQANMGSTEAMGVTESPGTTGDDRAFMLQSLEAYQTLQEEIWLQNQQEQLINDIAQKMRQSLDLDDILQVMVSEGRKLLRSDRLFLFKLHDSTQGTVIQESVAMGYLSLQGMTLDHSCFEEHFKGKKSKDYKQDYDGLTYIIDDVENSSISEGCQQALRQYQVKSNLMMPVVYREQLWGFLVAHHCQEAHIWSDCEVALLNRLTTQSAIALSQGELYQKLATAQGELQQLALQDGLTRIANRHRFDEYFRQEWIRAQGNNTSLGLGFADLDYFQQFNDRYGNMAGDRCLQQVAQTLQASLEQSADLAARYRGARFALVLPNTHPATAEKWADRLRQRIQDLHITHQGSPYGQITLSLGIICGQPQGSQAWDDWIKRASRALDRAKAEGRNRVCHDSLG